MPKIGGMLMVLIAAIFRNNSDAEKFRDLLTKATWTNNEVQVWPVEGNAFEIITKSSSTIKPASSEDIVIDVDTPPNKVEELKNLIHQHNGVYVPQDERQYWGIS